MMCQLMIYDSKFESVNRLFKSPVRYNIPCYIRYPNRNLTIHVLVCLKLLKFSGTFIYFKRNAFFESTAHFNN